jgi:hypothetical protein
VRVRSTYYTDRPDAKGQKVAAVLDIRELARVNDLIEDLIDLKTIAKTKGSALDMGQNSE